MTQNSRHNSKHAFLRSLCLSLLVFFSLLSARTASASQFPQIIGPQTGVSTPDLSDAKVHGYFFYAKECSHCIAILNEILQPLEQQYPGQIDIRLLEIGNSSCYQALMTAEEFFAVSPNERDLPTVVLGDQILIGEEQNRQKLASIITDGLEGAGIAFPDIPCVEPEQMLSMPFDSSFTTGEMCTIDDPSACSVAAPIYAAYFYQVGCKECSRVDADIKYLQQIYPQLVIQEFNIYDETALANWMADRVGRTDDIASPALFIGDKAWIGEGEITPQALQTELDRIAEKGAKPFWNDFDPDTGTNALISKFKSIGWIAILLAGLVDGLNPCAFATIVFFVSYLTLSGKKGKEILITGAAFTLGVFLTYLAVGLGFHKVLDLVRGTLNTISQIVYGITALLCLVLAVLSLKDFFKARKGDIGDMALKLPEPLRKRINATIREGRKASGYYVGAFVTGIIISILELACTGQIYLPTIIYLSSVPELRSRAISFLVLYNVMFIIPLIVVFILAFYGTTSKDLTKFLQKHAAAVKLGMALVFIGLSAWLLLSIFA